MALTNQYYDQNSKDFINSTLNIDMSSLYEKFEKHLKNGDRILDIGCGPGRDVHYFSKKYQVQGIEPSEKLAEHAKSYTQCLIHKMDFKNFNSNEQFNGIWACASLLHIPKLELNETFVKIKKLLRMNGVFYCSFKFGDFEGDRNGRYFTDLSVEQFEKLLPPGLSMVDLWLTKDLRPGRENEEWLNGILIRK